MIELSIGLGVIVNILLIYSIYILYKIEKEIKEANKDEENKPWE